MLDSQKDSFGTKDTALAAYLYSEGFSLSSIDSNSFPAVFYFENTNNELKDFVRSYQTGKATGNIALFFRAYKILLSKIKNG